MKENQNPPPELLPNQRPNTEDFLTFLCFRNTPVLPPALDFLNPHKQRKATQKPKSSGETSGSANKKMGLTSSTSKSDGKGENIAAASPAKNETKTEENGESSKSTKTAAFPGAVRKRAEKVPMTTNKFQQNEGKKQKNDTKVANALKKKYAKLNKVAATATNKTDVVRRTRAHPGAGPEQATNDSDVKESGGHKTPQKRKSSLQKNLSNNSLTLQEDQPPPVKKTPRTLVREGSLGNVKVILNKDELESVSSRGTGAGDNIKKKKRGKGALSKKENQTETALEVNDATMQGEVLVEQEPDKIERRQTRFASFRIPPPLKKERKKKVESPAVVEQQPETSVTPEPIPETKVSPVGNKKANKSLESSNENKKVVPEEKDEPMNKRLKKEIDFSSEDDEPLIKTGTGKRTPMNESDEGTSKRKFLFHLQFFKFHSILIKCLLLNYSWSSYFTQGPTEKIQFHR